MENIEINRAYLETLSYADLLKIADDNGIDVPADLSRGFLIGEIIEIIDENKKAGDEIDMMISDSMTAMESDDLSLRTFNSTEVEVVLRNPAWAFVYWNISESDRISLEKAFISQMVLRVSFFNAKEEIKPDEYFDVQISKDDSGQYVLLPAGKKFFRVDLLFNIDGIIDILSSSKTIEMPAGAEVLSDFRPGKNENISEILKLSGFNKLLLEHYKNHRESFS